MYENLKEYIEKGYSSRRIAKELNVSNSAIRYQLSRLGVKTNAKNYLKNKRLLEGVSYCTLCTSELPIDNFYVKRDNSGVSKFCKLCSKRQVVIRQRKFKEILVKYKGGKCEKCAYDKCIAAFDFHHTDPSRKDFMLSDATGNVFNEQVKNEIDKCILLCSNCHREEHYEMIVFPHEVQLEE